MNSKESILNMIATEATESNGDLQLPEAADNDFDLRMNIIQALQDRSFAASVLREVLAEVAKEGICVKVLNWYLHGADSNDEQSSTEPDLCGTCIVCLAREIASDK